MTSGKLPRIPDPCPRCGGNKRDVVNSEVDRCSNCGYENYLWSWHIEYVKSREEESDQAIKKEIWENAGMEGYDQMEAEQEAEARMETQEPDEFPAGVDGGEVGEQKLQGEVELNGKDNESTLTIRPDDFNDYDDPEAEEVRKEDEASAKASEQAERESS